MTAYKFQNKMDKREEYSGDFALRRYKRPELNSVTQKITKVSVETQKALSLIYLNLVYQFEYTHMYALGGIP